MPKESNPASARIDALDSAGNTLFWVDPIRWRPLALAGEWKAALEGDKQVQGSAAVALADNPPSLPQPGLPQSLRIDYRFAPGWRYAVVAPPPAIAPITGKPRELGLWLYGDASGNSLRCRYQDATGQMFQATYGPIDFTGWKWITLPIDGRLAHHWGGANDGTVHYPVKWNALLLIDSAKLKVNQDLRLHAAGFALQY